MLIFQMGKSAEKTGNLPKVPELVSKTTETDLPPSIFNGTLQLPCQGPTFLRFVLQPQPGLVDGLLSLGNHL